MFFVSDRVVLRRSSFSEYKSFSALIGLHVYSRRDDLRDFWWMSCRMARHIVIWCKNITEKLNPWVGYTHVTDDRQTDSYDGFAMPFVKLNMTVNVAPVVRLAVNFFMASGAWWWLDHIDHDVILSNRRSTDQLLSHVSTVRSCNVFISDCWSVPLSLWAG